MKFTSLFREIDTGTYGVLDESKFRRLLTVMNMVESTDEVNYLVGKIDPFFLNSMTYSDVVQLLSSHMVVDTSSMRDYDQEPLSIPLLEKFSNQEFS